MLLNNKINTCILYLDLLQIIADLTNQRHIIKKIIVEVIVQQKDNAYELQQKIGNLVQHKLTGLLEKKCDQYSPENELHRFEKLEIDLGRLNVDNLEQELTEKVDAEFKRILEQNVAQLELTPELSENKCYKSKQALIELFITTGTLPWWADNKNKELIADTYSELIKSEKQKEMLYKLLLKDNKFLLRFINHLSDKSLNKMFEFSSQGTKAIQLQLYNFIHQQIKAIESLKHIPKNRIRQIIWSSIFKASFNNLDYNGLTTLALKNISEQLGMHINSFISAFSMAIKKTKSNKQPAIINKSIKILKRL